MTEETQPTKADDLKLDHYKEILEQQKTVSQLQEAYDLASEASKAAKKNYDNALSVLCAIIRRGPDRQLRLPVDEEDESQADTDWRDIEVTDKGLGLPHAEKIHNYGLRTMGELVRHMNHCEGIHWADEIVGIGDKAREKVEAWFEAFWKENPQYCEEGEA